MGDSEPNPFNASSEKNPSTVRIQVIALDSLLYTRPVSLLKIDVEGMEGAVLAGARELLARDLPVVYFEVLSIEGLTSSFDLLRALDYRLFWMETHRFNRANFRNNPNNIWDRTEMGVIALPLGVGVHAELPVVDSVPPSIPHREDPAVGTDCSESDWF